VSFAFQALKTALGSGFDWTTADVRLLLLDAAGGFSEDPTLDFVSAVDGELATDGYARQPITGRTTERDDDELLVRWHADATVFPDLGPGLGGPSVGGAIVFVFVTDDSDSWPALYLDDVDAATEGTDFTVSYDAAGLVRLRAPE
jgi:hypothetical protein